MSENSPFLEAIRKEMQVRGYSLRTEKTYLHWIKPPLRLLVPRAQGERGLGSGSKL